MSLFFDPALTLSPGVALVLPFARLSLLTEKDADKATLANDNATMATKSSLTVIGIILVLASGCVRKFVWREMDDGGWYLEYPQVLIMPAATLHSRTRFLKEVAVAVVGHL